MSILAVFVLFRQVKVKKI